MASDSHRALRVQTAFTATFPAGVVEIADLHDGKWRME
jgi:hypothetical protein